MIFSELRSCVEAGTSDSVDKNISVKYQFTLAVAVEAIFFKSSEPRLAIALVVSVRSCLRP